MIGNQQIGVMVECTNGGEFRKAGGGEVLWALEFQAKMFKPCLVHLRRFQCVIRVVVSAQIV